MNTTTRPVALVVRPIVTRYGRPLDRVRCGGGWRRLAKRPCSGNY